MSERGCTCTTLRHNRGCPLEHQNRLDYSQPERPMTPATAAGRALIESLHYEYHGGIDPLDCDGTDCDFVRDVLAIEREAAAQALADAVPRVAWGLRRYWILAGTANPDYERGARGLLGIAAAPASPGVEG